MTVKRQIPMPTPIEWRELPYAKRIDIVVKQFIIKCSDQDLFVGGKMNRSYFAIRKFLDKRPLDEIAKIYDYLFTLTEKTPINITKLYEVSERHRKRLLADEQRAQVSQMNVEQYKELSIDDILNM